MPEFRHLNTLLVIVLQNSNHLIVEGKINLFYVDFLVTEPCFTYFVVKQ